MRAWKLLKLGVSLADQETQPAHLLDWLIEIDGAFHQVANEKGGQSGADVDSSGVPGSGFGDP